MPFKIVRQHTQNGPVLLVVPDKWEKGNYLFWPGHLTYNQRRKLRKNEKSSPDDKWAVQRCKLRATGLKTYHEAEEQIDAQIELSENASFVESDSDEEKGVEQLRAEGGKRRKLERAGICHKPMPNQAETSHRAQLRRFVEGHHQLEAQQRRRLQEKRPRKQCTHEHLVSIVEVKQEILIEGDGEQLRRRREQQQRREQERQGQQPGEQPPHRHQYHQRRRVTFPYFSASRVCTGHDILNHKVDKLLRVMSNVGLVLDSVSEAIALVNFKVEALTRKSSSRRSATGTTVRPASGTTTRPNLVHSGGVSIAAADTSALVPMPIDNANDAKDINQKLRNDKIFKQLWLNYLTKKFGKTGYYFGDGMACAHQLVDKVFSRRFLMQCTWSSDTPIGLKFAIKEYRHIIEVFYTALKFADPILSLERVEKFFRTYLSTSMRHSAPPKESSLTRHCHCRRFASLVRHANPARNQVPSNMLEAEATLHVADGVSQFRHVAQSASVE